MKKINFIGVSAAIIIIFIAIILIVSWFLISMGDNHLLDSKNSKYPLEIKDTQGYPLCIDGEGGWSCRFFEMTNQEIEYYKYKCEEMDGKWGCYSECTSDSPHYCNFKFKDRGDLCISNLQCGGKCLGEWGVGRCSDYTIGGCDTYPPSDEISPNLPIYEIYFGIPIFRSDLLCDD